MAEPDELSRFVTGSDDRLVAISQQERYLAVSPANARFNLSSPGQMVDLHITEIIGTSRYENRAAPALRKVFSGTRQSYVYPFESGGGKARLIHCEMDPIRDRSDQIYCALIRMTDVTETVSTGSGSVA